MYAPSPPNDPPQITSYDRPSKHIVLLHSSHHTRYDCMTLSFALPSHRLTRPVSFLLPILFLDLPAYSDDAFSDTGFTAATDIIALREDQTRVIELLKPRSFPECGCDDSRYTRRAQGNGGTEVRGSRSLAPSAGDPRLSFKTSFHLLHRRWLAFVRSPKFELMGSIELCTRVLR